MLIAELRSRTLRARLELACKKEAEAKATAKRLYTNGYRQGVQDIPAILEGMGEDADAGYDRHYTQFYEGYSKEQQAGYRAALTEHLPHFEIRSEWAAGENEFSGDSPPIGLTISWEIQK